jgi:pyrrolysine biosynthesis protein PylD
LTEATEIADYRFIIDASAQGGWLKSDMLHPEALILTPGVPLSLDEEAHTTFKSQTLHDLLPIGVSVMLATVCKS